MHLRKRLISHRPASSTGGGAAPTVVTSPSVSAALVGSPTSASAGTYAGSPTPTRSGIQWTLDGLAISGATGSTYTPLSSDATHALRYTETFTNSNGSVTGTSNAVTVGTASVLTKSRIGLNLQPFIYSNNQSGPVNFLKGQGGGFALPAGSGAGTATVDSNGWPTEDFSVAGYTGNPSVTVGTWTIQFLGQANLTFLYATSATSLALSSYNSGTNISTWTFQWAPTGLPPTFVFSNTKRLATDTAPTGLTNIYIWPAPYVGNTTQVWTNELATYLTDFAVLRTMDQQGINTDFTTTTWASRYTSPGFVGIEDLVALANQTSKDLWMCIPLFATADWDNNFFTYINANLNAGLHLYFEYSNENWNSTQPRYHILGNLEAAELHGGWGASVSNAGEQQRNLVSYVSDGAHTTVTCQGWAPSSELSVGSKLSIRNIGSLSTATNGSSFVTVSAVTSTTVTYNDTTTPSTGGSSVAITSTNTNFVCNDVVSTLSNVGSFVDYTLGANVYAARRIAQASDRCRAIVGASNMMTRFRPVLGDIQANANEEFLVGYINQYATLNSRVVSGEIYAFSGAPYYALGGQSTGIYCNAGASCPVITVDNTATAMGLAAAASKVDYHYGTRLVTALKYGIKVTMYEYGFDVNSNWNAGTQNQINRNAAKLDTNVYAGVYQAFQDVSSHQTDVVLWYDGLANPNLSTASDTFEWGFTDYETRSPKPPIWQAVEDFNALSTVPPLNGIGGSSVGTVTVIDGRLDAGTYVTTGAYSGLHTAGGTQNYLVTIEVAGTYTFLFNYALQVPGANVAPYVVGCDTSANILSFTPTQTDSYGTLNGNQASPTSSGVVLGTGVHLFSISGVAGGGPDNEAFKSITLTRTA